MNPFEYEAAKKLSPKALLDFYVEDHNYTRFIQSSRNIFLMGDRGSGKSMTLLYNAFKYRKAHFENNSLSIDLRYVGIYIPCNTTLFHKQEHLLMDEFRGELLSEQYLVLSIIDSIAETLLEVQKTIKKIDNQALRSEFEYIINEKLPPRVSFFKAISLFSKAKLSLLQQTMNQMTDKGSIDKTYTFSSTILPLVSCILNNIPELSETHLLFLIDDAHDLNEQQRLLINTWISYRDNFQFSFKVATAEGQDLKYHTISGGSILENHDYIKLSMEGEFQNPFSQFYKLAQDIIVKRLNNAGIISTAEKFFPTNQQFLADIDKYRKKLRQNYLERHPTADIKKVNDFVYKYARAEYFKNRSPRANKPPYSGFETIVHLSTGIIRNLLYPCYWMFDAEFSKKRSVKKISEIPPSVQRAEILKASRGLWEKIDHGLEKVIDNCSKEQGDQLRDLFYALADLFRERLKHHKSEPRAIVFTVSAITSKFDSILKPLFDIARKAQMLYTRTSPAKEIGRQETYYVPNRLLWPNQGLDPVGQHARVSIRETHLINATKGKAIPFKADDKQDIDEQEELF